MCRGAIAECGGCTRLLSNPNEWVPKLLFQAMLIAGRGRPVAAITPGGVRDT